MTNDPRKLSAQGARTCLGIIADAIPGGTDTIRAWDLIRAHCDALESDLSAALSKLETARQALKSILRDDEDGEPESRNLSGARDVAYEALQKIGEGKG